MKSVAFFSILSCVAIVYPASPQPTPISVAGASSISASGHSYLPVLSADRRYVVFLSSAKNLVPNDDLSSSVDVFLYDLQPRVPGSLTLISRAHNSTSGANGHSKSPSISSNGQSIVYASDASDLIPDFDFNGSHDIFLAASTLSQTLITARPDGNSPVNPIPTRNVPLSDRPLVSADGLWIAFESVATNLTSEIDTNSESDVFLHNVFSNQTFLISVALEGGRTANGSSRILDMTTDARYIVFTSTATNLLNDSPTNGLETLYVRDVLANETTLVPQVRFSTPRKASISEDGRFVLYKCEWPTATWNEVVLFDRLLATNILVGNQSRLEASVYLSSDARYMGYDYTNRAILWDRQTDTRSVLNADIPNSISHSPVVSADGSIVAFVSAPPNNTYQIYLTNMLTGQLRLITETLAGGPSAKDHSSATIALDPAGEFILFDSAEDHLVPGDYNQASDVFVHQIATGETRLISRAHDAKPALTPFGRSGITNFCVSATGDRILFFSLDSNLVLNDTNGWQDAFLWDSSAGQIMALSTNESGLFGATNAVLHGQLSANGRYAVLGSYHSQGRAAFSYNTPYRIVQKDLETGETLSVVSNVITGGSLPQSLPMFAFSVSANGRWIAYPSNNMIIVADMQLGVHTNLTAGDPNWNEPLISGDGRYVLHVKANPRILAVTDLLTGQRTTVNSNYVCGAAFSQDGGHIVYGAPALPVLGLYVYYIPHGTNALVCTNCANPSVSADARFVAYEIAVGTSRQVGLKDMFTGATTLVSRNIMNTGAGNADAPWPVISADGRYIAYTSKATNLTTDVPNGWNNLYVYDRLQGTTVRITGANGNTGYGSGSASQPVLGPDGRTLVFQSFASDFIDNDFNDTRDIFLLRLGQGDNDNDGMSDSWEQTYFSTTEREGTGDIDQDGQTDLAEYLAGTNPNNAQSVLEVLQITSIGTGERQLIWAAQPGKSYRLEYKTDLDGAAWTSLGQIITATGPSASAIDSTAASEKRFYRVALVQ